MVIDTREDYGQFKNKASAIDIDLISFSTSESHVSSRRYAGFGLFGISAQTFCLDVTQSNIISPELQKEFVFCTANYRN